MRASHRPHPTADTFTLRLAAVMLVTETGSVVMKFLLGLIIVAFASQAHANTMYCSERYPDCSERIVVGDDGFLTVTSGYGEKWELTRRGIPFGAGTGMPFRALQDAETYEEMGAFRFLDDDTLLYNMIIYRRRAN